MIVVYDKKTKKIYEHFYKDNGEIYLATVSGINMNDQDLIVSDVPVDLVDTLNWYVLDECDREKSNL